MPFEDLFKKLFELKHRNHALWNGAEGGVMIRIFNNKQDQVLSFSRTKNNDRVINITNYSPEQTTVQLDSKFQKGTYTELFTGEKMELKGEDVFTLKPWQYLVLVK